MMITKTRKIGGSLVVTIPREIVRAERLVENQEVEIKIRKRRKDFFGALKEIESFSESDRMQDRL